MKITITLTSAEVKGIKAYLKAVEAIEKPTKKNIQEVVINYVDCINSPREAVSDFIRIEALKENQ